MKITRNDIQSAEYIFHDYLKFNLTFLDFLKTTISNSEWYSSSLKIELQYDTLFLTLSVNETDQQNLLKVLMQK